MAVRRTDVTIDENTQFIEMCDNLKRKNFSKLVVTVPKEEINKPTPIRETVKYVDEMSSILFAPHINAHGTKTISHNPSLACLKRRK